MNLILRRFLRYNLKQPPIVYRFIAAALMRNFFEYPFLFQNRNLGQTSFVNDTMKQRVIKDRLNLLSLTIINKCRQWKLRIV